jgi:hypothetical protein
MVGLVGGVSMAAIAGARRTQAVFPAALAASNTSDLQFNVVDRENPVDELDPTLLTRLTRLPGVERVALTAYMNVIPVGRDGLPSASAFNNDGSVQGSWNGEYFAQDRPTVIEGRMANPVAAGEMMATAAAAEEFGWHLGETVRLGVYTDQQVIAPTFSPATRPTQVFPDKLVGLVVLPDQVVHDSVDNGPGPVLLTPALSRRLAASLAYPTYGLRLRNGAAGVTDVEREVVGATPRGDTYIFTVTSVSEGQVLRASKPEAIALGVFGLIAALAVLLIAGQAIGRSLWNDGDDLDVLRSLGSNPLDLAGAAVVGLLGSIVAGAALAVGVAVALSPIAPLGPARVVDPTPGVAFDGTVLGIGATVLVVVLGALSVVLAWRQVTRRRRVEPVLHQSAVAGAAAGAGLPMPAVVGLRHALEPGRGRTAVPVRSVLVGAVLAVLVLVATLTFASGFHTLVSHPALYGWNWDDAIVCPSECNFPPAAQKLLDRDPDVAGWAGYNFATVQIDGQTVPALLVQPGAGVAPPILSGHDLTATDQVVLGAGTLAALHRNVGDTVSLSYGSPQDYPIYVPPTPIKVVGSATMPAIGDSEGGLHPSMGIGALVSQAIEPPSLRKVLLNPDPNLNGPSLVAVTYRSGVTPAEGRRSLQRIVTAADRVMAADPQGQGDIFSVEGVQQPAEIVNYGRGGASAAVLAGGLAVAAAAALALALTASVRRRRRDLALLKALGFTRRQLAVTVAAQASVAAVVGIVVGVPLGIALGRWLWDLFARDIYAVPDPTVPVVQLIVVAIGALVLANLVAAVPGRVAARTPTALVLRAE